MTTSGRWAGRVAVGIVRADPPQVAVAESAEVLGRVLALHVVAQTDAADLGDSGRLEEIRAALMEERWADALSHWIDATGIAVDAYPDEDVWSEDALDAESASFEIRLAPIFRD